jgi:hypothetical protein
MDETGKPAGGRRGPTKLTNEFVRSISAPATGSATFWDNGHKDAVRGFGLRVHAVSDRSSRSADGRRQGAATSGPHEDWPSKRALSARWEAELFVRLPKDDLLANKLKRHFAVAIAALASDRARREPTHDDLLKLIIMARALYESEYRSREMKARLEDLGGPELIERTVELTETNEVAMH